MITAVLNFKCPLWVGRKLLLHFLHFHQRKIFSGKGEPCWAEICSCNFCISTIHGGQRSEFARPLKILSIARLSDVYTKFLGTFDTKSTLLS